MSGKIRCPKCKGDLVAEDCVNRDPIGIPIFRRWVCKKCGIGTVNGIEWWTNKGRWYPKNVAGKQK